MYVLSGLKFSEARYIFGFEVFSETTKPKISRYNIAKTISFVVGYALSDILLYLTLHDGKVSLCTNATKRLSL